MPKDASRDFGTEFIKNVLPAILNDSDNILKNATSPEVPKSSGLTAQNLNAEGSLSLYLFNNETDTGSTEPNYGFSLLNSSTALMTLYNTTTYSNEADLLNKQENTGGTDGLLNQVGDIKVAPLPDPLP